jgi:hypothetical protein
MAGATGLTSCSCSRQPERATGAGEPVPAPTGDPARRETTRRYWQGLLGVSREVNAIEHDPKYKALSTTDPTTADEMVAHCRRAARVCEELDDRCRALVTALEALPLVGVDPEALDVGSLMADHLREQRS